MVDSVIETISAEQFLQLPETTVPTELIEGEIIVSPTPNIPHQRLVFKLAKLVEVVIPDGEIIIAPMDVYLDDNNVVQPDIFWVSANGLAVPDGTKFFRGAPDLVIEILSPSTTRRDREAKFRLYERFGVREYWLVDPEAQLIEVYRLVNGKFERVGFYGKGETLTTPTLNDAPILMDAVFG